jgi:hypothetical protein
MKFFIAFICSVLLSLGAKAQDPYSMMWNQIGIDPSALYARYVPFLDNGYCLVYLDGIPSNVLSRRPRCASIGGGLTLSAGVLSSTGSAGPTGPQGPEGIQGPAGVAG